MLVRLIKFFATFGGLGYLKIAPGTIGSLAAVAIYLLIKQNLSIYAGVTAAFLVLGFLVSGKAEKVFKKKDARIIIIDDACGFFIAMFLIPFSLMNLLIVFLLYRAFDITKLFPIKRVEGLPGSLGIMGDDILAGIYANLLFRLILTYLI